jgi:enoyl-CoA hydratase/carnithine racemase
VSGIDDSAGVRFTVDGAVATVTLDRAEARNAQLPSTWAAMAGFGATLGEAVRIVVVRGVGQSFSAGMDRRLFDPAGVPGEPSLRELAALSDEEIEARIAAFQEGFRWLADPRIISIAAVQGHAVGAGFQLSLACDLRVLADDAMFAMRETSLGLVPDLTGTHPLVRAAGYARALEICATGRWVDATEAAAIGLATVVVPRADLDGTVDDLTAALLEAPQGAVRDTKRLLLSATDADREAQLLAERHTQVTRLRDLDRSVGESAHVAKR